MWYSEFGWISSKKHGVKKQSSSDAGVHYIIRFNLAHFETANEITQLIFTCSKSTIETLEKGVKYVQS